MAQLQAAAVSAGALEPQSAPPDPYTTQALISSTAFGASVWCRGCWLMFGVFWSGSVLVGCECVEVWGLACGVSFGMRCVVGGL